MLLKGCHMRETDCSVRTAPRSTGGNVLSQPSQGGDTLLEVLVTLVILAFGLLGFIALQAKVQALDADSFGRAQALILLSDIMGRMNANRLHAVDYVTTSTPIGTGDSQPTDCNSTTIGAPRDICEWSNALKGAGERRSSANVGAMLGARGCIEQIQTPDPTAGVCTPGIYRVTVVWQGLTKTSASVLTCGQDLYGAEEYRRAVAARVAVGLPSCL
jgi:type IV pilus assembly protein PilV